MIATVVNSQRGEEESSLDFMEKINGKLFSSVLENVVKVSVE